MTIKHFCPSSWRRLVRVACNAPLHAHGPSERFALPALRLSGSRRGAKTKTSIDFTPLPQGALVSPLSSSQDEENFPAYPPVIQQHLNHVKQFSDCVVLTRVGNFYELYAEQAEQYAPLLNLKVAQRKTSLGPVAMAGFQYIYLDRYLKVLVQGLQLHVAISEEFRNSAAEQVRTGGTLYTRRISRVITPGTLIDENFVDPFEDNYVLSVHIDDEPSTTSIDNVNMDTNILSHCQLASIGLAWVDLSSGEFYTQSTQLASLKSVVARIRPKEIILDTKLKHTLNVDLSTLFGEGSHVIALHSPVQPLSTIDDWSSLLDKPIPAESRPAFSINEISAASLLLDYVKDKIMDMELSLQCPVRRIEKENMSIDRHTLRGLEIRTTLREGAFQGSLLHAVRRTVTKSGARLLNQRLVSPSMSLDIINGRLDLVEHLVANPLLRSNIVSLLRRSSDSLRLLQKFSIGRGDADDLLALCKTITVTHNIYLLIEQHVAGLDTTGMTDLHLSSLSGLLARFDFEGPSRLATRIGNAIDEDGLSRQHLAEDTEAATFASMAEERTAEEGLHTAKGVKKPAKGVPADVSQEHDGEIWIMRKSASTFLRQAHAQLAEIDDQRTSLTLRLRKELGSNSLMLKWTPQLGHFCHVKGKDARTAVDGARHISSTKSTRTFYLQDWTTLGLKLDDLRSRIRTEEQRIFLALRKEVITNLTKLRRNAAGLDELDVACSSAILAEERNLVRPILNSGTEHNIIGGRHPMVDIGLQEHGRRFTANDCTVGEKNTILLITGPNMAGKSTFLRQNALITILAQTGCFVPAAYAEIGLVDKLFSRIGSADDVYNHQSTFMVEMLEVADILNQATERSFVIMDEVGRGTTPEDGTAVGYACLHHLHNENKCRALFATHFHKLVEMTADFQKLARYCTSIAEQADGTWVYVHKLREGVNRDSHALKVAKLAGLPPKAVEVAAEALNALESLSGQ